MQRLLRLTLPLLTIHAEKQFLPNTQLSFLVGAQWFVQIDLLPVNCHGYLCQAMQNRDRKFQHEGYLTLDTLD
jgi:hypothetical protein